MLSTAKYAFLILIACASRSYADNSLSVGDVIHGCRDAADGRLNRTTQRGLDGIYCLGLAEGIAAAMAWNCYSKISGSIPNSALVASPNATNTAIVQAFVNHADANPSEWIEPASVVMARAIRNEFPCDPEYMESVK